MRAPFAIGCLFGAGLALLASGAVEAGRPKRWTDANGVTHYGDHVPQAPASQPAPPALPPRHAAAETSPAAGLRTVAASGGFDAYADNRLGGPVEVALLLVRGENIHAAPALPVRAVVPALASARITHLQAAEPSRAAEFELRMESTPGDPRARPRDAEYLLPLHALPGRIEQGFGGSFSHTDSQNRYALDIAAPVGTPVLAARDGVVMEVASGFAEAGTERSRLAHRSNFVRLLHDDGAMSVYAHLRPGGVAVRPGDRVHAGQVIAESGNTGFSTGPHLHFVVQVNRGMRLESIPFRMRGPQGPLHLRGN